MKTAEPRGGSVPASNGNAFGCLLKEWRGRRGLSQLDLAIAARTTQRYLSFIESGRTAPSRDMVLRLGATLSLPLRQQNTLLLAAGYAPAWRERELATPDLAAVNRALDYMLARHEPYPAFVIDSHWDLLRANRGALKLTEFLIGATSPASSKEPVNLAIALLSPEGLRPFIVNWHEVARHFIRGVAADAERDGTPASADLLSRLLMLPDIPAVSEGMMQEMGESPVLPIHFAREATSLQLFTTIATLGTPRDVTLEEIRIEFFFPMDDTTADILASWAK
jgi:transcriptional regulator with XRE-family HTH domain